MDVQVKIQGVDVVRDVLLKLPPAMQKKALKPAMKRAMRVVKKAAEDNLEGVLSGESTGLLRKSLRIYNLRQKGKYLRTAVMVRRGAVYPNRVDKDGPVRVGLVAGVLEYGKKDQPPRTWIRKAAREKVQAVYSALGIEIKAGLEKAINSVRKKK